MSFLEGFKLSVEEAKATPSHVKGMSEEVERLLRTKLVDFICTMGRKMNLSQLVYSTASVFFHRYFAVQSFQDEEDPYLIAATCFFLSCKVEESPKPLEEVIYMYLKQRGVESSPDEINRYRDRFLSKELQLLQALSFDLTVVPPYKHMLSLANELNLAKEYRQIAWNFVNDSMRTNLCLVYDPKFIAGVAIKLAFDFFSDTAFPKEWFEKNFKTLEGLDSVGKYIKAQYELDNEKKILPSEIDVLSKLSKPNVSEKKESEDKTVDKSQDVSQSEASTEKKAPEVLKEVRNAESSRERSSREAEDRTGNNEGHGRRRHISRSHAHGRDDRHDRDEHKDRMDDRYERDHEHRDRKRGRDDDWDWRRRPPPRAAEEREEYRGRSPSRKRRESR